EEAAEVEPIAFRFVISVEARSRGEVEQAIVAAESVIQLAYLGVRNSEAEQIVSAKQDIKSLSSLLQTAGNLDPSHSHPNPKSSLRAKSEVFVSLGSMH